MFKGLKTKIAEETKRFQEAVVTQVGEGINNLTSSSKRLNELSDTPKNSPLKGDTRSKNGSQDNLSLIDVSLADLDRNYSSSSVADSFISAASSSSFMQEVDGELTPTRQRHDSFSSVGSVESFFPSVPTAGRLAPIPSDIETDVESVAGSSSFVTGASKEQISSVLTKLQGRAANYKDKYRHLLLSYKEMSKENEKIRTVLTTSQDKALRRIQELKEERKLDEKAKREMEETLRGKLLAQDGTIATLRHQVQLLKEGKPADDDVLNEVAVNHPPTAVFAEREKVKKLEELLNRCKESIKSYKEKIQTLSGENQELKKKFQEQDQEHRGNEEISDFVTERAVDEWKTKLKNSEESWKQKLLENFESNALTVAQIKQEMHSEIEKKDETIEDLRQLIKTTNENAAETKEKFQKELEKIKETEKMLEQDKKNLIQEVSRSKQAAVQIVKEEDEKKREQLQKQFEQNLIEKTSEFEKKLAEIRRECDQKCGEIEKQFETKMKSNEEQMNLAIEERDLQKMAALSQHDERLDVLRAENETLKTQKLQLETSLDAVKQENLNKFTEVSKKLTDKENSLNELNSEKISLEHELEELRKEFAASRHEFCSVYDENQKIKTEFEKKEEELRRISELVEGSSNDNKEINENLKNLENTLRLKEEDLTQLRTKFESVSQEMETLTNEMNETKKEFQAKHLRCEFMEKELKRILDEKRLIEDDFKKRLDQLMQSKSSELNEFRTQLDDIKNMEIAKINADLDRAREQFHQKESSLKQELQQKNDELMFSRDSAQQKDEVLTQLKRELSEKSVEFSSIVAEKENLHSEIVSLTDAKRKLETSLGDATSLRRELASVQMELEQARTYVKNLEQEKIFITEEKNLQIRESNEVLGALEDAVGVYRKQFDAQMKENEDNKRSTKFQIVENESRLNDFRDRICDLEEAVDVYKSRDVEKNSMVVEKNVEIENLREKLQNIIREGFFHSSEKNLRIQELMEKLDESDEAVEDFRNENSDLKQNLDSLQAQLKSVQAQLTSVRETSENETDAKIISLENSLNDLETKLAEKEQELKSTTASAEINKNELSFIFGAFVDCFDLYDVNNSFEKYTNLTPNERNSDVKNALIKTLRDFTSSYADKEKELDKFRADRVELEEKLKNVENLASKMKTSFETQNAERVKCLEEFQTASKEKQTYIDDLNSELERTKQKSALYESQLTSLSIENDHREELIRNLEATMKSFADEKNLEIARLRQTFDVVNEEISSKNQEILSLKLQISKMDETFQRSIDENKNLNEKLAEIKIFEEKSDRLVGQLEQANEKFEKSQKELNSARTELKSAQNELETLRDRLSSTEDVAKMANDDLEREKEKFNLECDARVADYKKKAETKLSQIKKLLETDKEVLNQRCIELESELAKKNADLELLSDRTASDLNSNEAKFSSQLADVERRCEEEKNLELKNVQDEYEKKIQTMVDDHNNRVKQLAKDFQADLAKKETEWQEELSSAYNKTDEDRQRVTKEYQKEMKQLYKNLQEKSQSNDEASATMEKEKSIELQALKDEHEKILKEKEEQFKISLKQILDDQEKQHKLELDGLTSEWNADRRHVLTSNDVKKQNDDDEHNFGIFRSQNLEHQAQVAQGDVQIESPLYLKQRVKQLESQLESYKQKRDFDHGTKNSHTSDANHQNNERLSSVSLDYSNPVFCEPTEAEYLRNIVFRYMVERESLGKESVTLAKAIAAVLKLSMDQTKEVLSKEEARLSTW